MSVVAGHVPYTMMPDEPNETMQRGGKGGDANKNFIHGEMKVLRSEGTHETQRVGSDAVGDARMHSVRGEGQAQAPDDCVSIPAAG